MFSVIVNVYPYYGRPVGHIDRVKTPETQPLEAILGSNLKHATQDADRPVDSFAYCVKIAESKQKPLEENRIK